VFIARRRAAAMHFIVGKKIHVRVNFAFQRGMLCRLPGWCVEWMSLLSFCCGGEGQSG
jgi:hypothetical protein